MLVSAQLVVSSHLFGGRGGGVTFCLELYLFGYFLGCLFESRVFGVGFKGKPKGKRVGLTLSFGEGFKGKPKGTPRYFFLCFGGGPSCRGHWISPKSIVDQFIVVSITDPFGGYSAFVRGSLFRIGFKVKPKGRLPLWGGPTLKKTLDPMVLCLGAAVGRKNKPRERMGPNPGPLVSRLLRKPTGPHNILGLFDSKQSI